MRDLYEALNLPGIVTDRSAVERALGQDGLAQDIRDAAWFVLLDPTRKARYDWVLGRTWELSAARACLGLGEDPRLPRRRTFRGPMAKGPEVVSAPTKSSGRTGWGVAVLLLVALLLWGGYSYNRKPPAVPEERPAVLPEAHGDKPRPPSDAPATLPQEEPASVPAPEHGWLQLGSEVSPLVPWHIDTEPGQDYVLTLLDVKSRVLLLTLYLRGGEPYRGLVPEGRFELSYSSGNRWFGFQHGFGTKAKVVQPALTYRVLAGLDGKGIWKLRLNPSSCEGLPRVSSATEDKLVTEPPDRSL